MDIPTENTIGDRLAQTRGVIAALLADLSEPAKRMLKPEAQANAIWAVDELLAQCEECLSTANKN